MLLLLSLTGGQWWTATRDRVPFAVKCVAPLSRDCNLHWSGRTPGKIFTENVGLKKKMQRKKEKNSVVSDWQPNLLPVTAHWCTTSFNSSVFFPPADNSCEHGLSPLPSLFFGFYLLVPFRSQGIEGDVAMLKTFASAGSVVRSYTTLVTFALDSLPGNQQWLGEIISVFRENKPSTYVPRRCQEAVRSGIPVDPRMSLSRFMSTVPSL